MFTAAELVSKVREVAAEKPDFVYERPPHGRCEYWDFTMDSCGCLLGAGLERLGVKHSYMPQEEWQYSITALFGRLIQHNLVSAEALEEPHFPDALGWLAEAQAQQDNGEKWGVCVKMADLAFWNVQ